MTNNNHFIIIAPEWQHPYVNVLKHFPVTNWKSCLRDGDVKVIMDKMIGKTVIQVTGSISASNYIRLPKKTNDNLGLSGRYAYVQILFHENKEYAMHFDAKDNDGNIHRITISNAFKNKTLKRNSRGIQIPLLLNNNENQWCIICVDFKGLLEEKTRSPFHYLSCIQFNANLSLRGVFTSDVLYYPNTYPKEMYLSNVIDIKSISYFSFPFIQNYDQHLNSTNEKKDTTNYNYKKISKFISKRNVKCNQLKQNVKSSIIPKDTIVNAKEIEKTISKFNVIIKLINVNGYNGIEVNLLKWMPMSKEIVFTCESLIIAMSSETKEQRYFIGHRQSITCLTCDTKGTLLITGESGNDPEIKIWHFKTQQCLSSFKAHKINIKDLDISKDNDYLVSIGLDEHKRQNIMIWHMKYTINSNELILDYLSSKNIKCIKWSIFENDKLFSCGIDNIRVHRLRDDKLRSMSINLTHLSSEIRSKLIFNCIAYEFMTDVIYDGQKQKHVFFGTTFGTLFQINYDNGCFERIFNLHNGSINTLVMSEGFIVTGSDDAYVKVWPLDFTDFLLEAENESSVTSLDLSLDGLNIILGTENGSIGLIDVANQTHATLLRSHRKKINALCIKQNVDFNNDIEILTASNDNTLRIWKLVDKVLIQIFEFSLSNVNVLSVVYDEKSDRIISGFSNGYIRIFDAKENFKLIHERNLQSDAAIISLKCYGNVLYVGTSHNYMHMCDITKELRIVKSIRCYISNYHHQMMTNTFDIMHNKLIAQNINLTEDNKIEIVVYDLPLMELYTKIETTFEDYCRLKLSPDAKDIWVLGSSSLSSSSSNHGFVIIDVYNIIENKKIYRYKNNTLNLLSSFIINFKMGILIMSDSNGYIEINEIDYNDDIMITQLQRYSMHIGKITDMQLYHNYLICVDEYGNIFNWEFDISYFNKKVTKANDDTNETTIIEPISLSHLYEDRGYPLPQPLPAPFKSNQRNINLIPSTRPLTHGLSSNRNNFVLINYNNSKLLAYISGPNIIIEDLNTFKKNYLIHHNHMISVLEISYDEQLLASGSSSVQEQSGCADICLWDINELKIKYILKYHPCTVKMMKFFMNNEYLVSIDTMTSVVLWDIMSSSPLVVGRSTDVIKSIAINMNSYIPEFITITENEVHIWRLDADSLGRGSINFTSDLNHKLIDICYMNDIILISDYNGNIWQIKDNIYIKKIISLDDVNISCMYTSSYDYLAIGTAQGMLFIYKFENDQWNYQISFNFNNLIINIQFDCSFTHGMIYTDDCSIYHIYPKDNKYEIHMRGHPNEISFIDIHNDSNLIAVIYIDGSARIWNFEKEQSIAECCSSTSSSVSYFSRIKISNCQKYCLLGSNDGSLSKINLSFDDNSEFNNNDIENEQWSLNWHDNEILGLDMDLNDISIISISKIGDICIGSNDGNIKNKIIKTKRNDVLVNYFELDEKKIRALITWMDGFDVFSINWHEHYISSIISKRLNIEVTKLDYGIHKSSCIFHPTNKDLIIFCSTFLNEIIHIYDLTSYSNEILSINITNSIPLGIGDITSLKCVKQHCNDNYKVMFGTTHGGIISYDCITGHIDKVIEWNDGPIWIWNVNHHDNCSNFLASSKNLILSWNI